LGGDKACLIIGEGNAGEITGTQSKKGFVSAEDDELEAQFRVERIKPCGEGGGLLGAPSIVRRACNPMPVVLEGLVRDYIEVSGYGSTFKQSFHGIPPGNRHSSEQVRGLP
jgi:hypothetical protein